MDYVDSRARVSTVIGCLEQAVSVKLIRNIPQTSPKNKEIA